MATPDFHYQDPFPLEKDDTQYRLITSNYVSVGEFEGHPMLKVEPEGLRLLAAEAFHDVAFFLRPAHLKQVAAILDDPEASANDKSVALTMLRNAEVAGRRHPSLLQDTGTATIVGKKGQQVWTGCDDCRISFPRRVRRLHPEQPALLPNRGAGHVHGEEHRNQPARPDRH